MAARIVKSPTERRSDILEAAQRFTVTKGFEQMTIQDILDDLHISKGAFYHYFASKQTLLDALIELYLDQSMEIILPIVEDPNLTATEKFKRLFSVVARWKLAQKPFMLALLRVWYLDENALVRQKQIAATLELVGPQISRIVRQGMQEGVFETPYSEQIGEVVLVLMIGLGDAVAALLLSNASPQETMEHLNAVYAVYSDSIERILGAAHGALHLYEPAMLQAWITTSADD